MLKQRIVSMFLAAAMAVGCLVFAAPAAEARRANSREKAWRIGTYVSGAATAAALAKGKGTWALIGAGAGLLSYSQWRKEMKRRHRDTSYASYRRYRRSYRSSRRR